MIDMTELVNYSLAQLGESDEVENWETDDSVAAQASRRVFPTMFEEKLREYRWTFARKTGPLSLVASDPNSDWSYAYRTPPDSIDFIRILNGDRDGMELPRTPFIQGADNVGGLIFTDQQNAEGEWTFRNPVFQSWSADFKTAIAFELAALIAPSVMKDLGHQERSRLLTVAGLKWAWAKKTDRRGMALNVPPPSKIQQSRNSATITNRKGDL